MAEIRALLVKLVHELNAQGPHLPVYWGNRNWHPMLTDVVEQMADDGIQHAVAFVTSAFGSYSGCRQYREDIARARQEVGAAAPQIDVIRRFYNHPGFIESVVDQVRAALGELPADCREKAAVDLHGPQHSGGHGEIGPLRRATSRGMPARRRNDSAPELAIGFPESKRPPVAAVAGARRRIGGSGNRRRRAMSREVCGRAHRIPPRAHRGYFRPRCRDPRALRRVGLTMVRAETPGLHPRFVQMIRELILERTNPGSPRLALGPEGPPPDGPSPLECRPGCCKVEKSEVRNPKSTKGYVVPDSE